MAAATWRSDCLLDSNVYHLHYSQIPSLIRWTKVCHQMAHSGSLKTQSDRSTSSVPPTPDRSHPIIPSPRAHQSPIPSLHYSVPTWDPGMPPQLAGTENQSLMPVMTALLTPCVTCSKTPATSPWRRWTRGGWGNFLCSIPAPVLLVRLVFNIIFSW